MKQLLQNLENGTTEIVECPDPIVRQGHVLVQTARTVVSSGTERMLVEFGRASLLDKARQQPDKVRQVLDKIRTDGLATTVEAVRSRLDQPLPLGYCNAGTIVAVGEDVRELGVGDRVASNGAHAELVSVPVNLCARIPPEVPDEAAAFATIGAIALQGIRLAQLTLGECVAVTGLGLIGLVTIQLLRAHGCRVLGLDPDPARADLARALGADAVTTATNDPLAEATMFSRGRGVDAVLITASTSSSEPVRQAARMCRKRGRIVLVGVTGLELSRADFYEKEISFQVSCSFGPGRYDPTYEELGRDYPIGFVRWTEQRNLEAVLDLMAAGTIDTRPLVTHRFPFVEARRAYDLLVSSEPSLGIILDYGASDDNESRATRPASSVSLPGRTQPPEESPVVSFIGAGNYATRVLIPAFLHAGASLHTLVTTGGPASVHYGRKFGFREATSDLEHALSNPAVEAVVIATRHDSHADLVCKALQAGKHVFVEKPLALHAEELERIAATFHELSRNSASILAVGFNRRFAPQIHRMKAMLGSTGEPKVMLMTMNAGDIPPGHWTQRPEAGGGRILGEACHAIDLLRYLAGCEITGFSVAGVSRLDAVPVDTATFTLRFADGSIGTVHYLANGHRSFPKERLEVFVAGRVLELENYRRLRGYGWPGFSTMSLWKQDKGQRACAKAFLHGIRNEGEGLTPFHEILEVSRTTIAIAESLSGSGTTA